jgi:tRNA1(Val) A37 N6-methylase TrmN6
MSDPAAAGGGSAASTVDAFHRGDFWVVQPQGKGHRSGMDAMMLAATVPDAFSGRLADLGSGAGAAGLAVASRCPKANVVLVENEPEMADFARRSIALPQNAHLAGRAAVLEADVTLSGRAREAAGLIDSSFDFAIMNPPFNAGHDRPTPDVLKRQAHVMPAGMLEKWVRTAAAIVKPRGGLAAIVRPVLLPELLDALRNRFGHAEIVPVHPRAEAPAIRVILRAVRGSRKALSLHPPLVLHGETGHAHAPRADLVCNGRASLFGD